MAAGLVGLTGFVPGVADATGDVVECSGVLTDEALPNVLVPPGESCTIIDSTVDGDVTAGERSTLRIQTSTVHGDVRAIDADRVSLLGPSTAPGTGSPDVVIGTVVDGDVEITGTGQHLTTQSVDTAVCGTRVGGSVRIIESRSVAFGGAVNSGAACRGSGGGNEIGGNAAVIDSYGPFFRVATNAIAGNLIVVSNEVPSPMQVLDNVVGRNLNCASNVGSPVVIAGNVAARANGQCAA